MNTTGIQNYLSNVFRPIVSYSDSNFTPKLELSNIDTYSGNVVSVIRGDIGDTRGNVYVGLLSGNPIIDTRACSNVSAFGNSAGSNISNCSNSVYVGFRAGEGSTSNQSVIAVGYQAGLGGTGVSNIFIGAGTKSTIGSNNIFIGNGIDLSASNTLRIGTPIAANLSTNWVGFNGLVSPLSTGNTLDASGLVQIDGQVGINITPGTRTLDVNGNFRAQDASMNALDFSNGFTRSTGGYVSIQSNIPVTAGNPTPIGQLKKGIVLISTVSRSDATDGATLMTLARTTSNSTDVFHTYSGNARLSVSSSNILLVDSNANATYDYNITYFPLP